MRRLIAAAVLFISVITAYLSGYLYIDKTCNSAKTLLKECSQEYENGSNPEKAAEKLERFWQEKEKILSVFADHTKIDEIEQVISTLKVYSTTDSKELFAEYSSTVETLLHQLKEDTVPSVHSIF